MKLQHKPSRPTEKYVRCCVCKLRRRSHPSDFSGHIEVATATGTTLWCAVPYSISRKSDSLASAQKLRLYAVAVSLVYYHACVHTYAYTVPHRSRARIWRAFCATKKTAQSLLRAALLSLCIYIYTGDYCVTVSNRRVLSFRLRSLVHVHEKKCGTCATQRARFEIELKERRERKYHKRRGVGSTWDLRR